MGLRGLITCSDTGSMQAAERETADGHVTDHLPNQKGLTVIQQQQQLSSSSRMQNKI